MIQTNDKLRRQLARIETRLQNHDERFAVVFDAIRQLMEEDDAPAAGPPIGFETEGHEGRESGK